MQNITLEEQGQRIYIVGNTYPIKDCIKTAGAHWDGEKKQWWIGKAKRSAVEACIAKHVPQPAADGQRPIETVADNTPVKGKVSYKGKTYYMLAQTQDGSSYKVCTLDGKLVFWARRDSGAAVVKTYGHERGFRGYSNYSRAHQHDIDYPTIGSIRSYIERAKKDPSSVRSGRQSSDDVRCRHCGEWTMGGDDWCQCCGKANYER